MSFIPPAWLEPVGAGRAAVSVLPGCTARAAGSSTAILVEFVFQRVALCTPIRSFVLASWQQQLPLLFRGSSAKADQIFFFMIHGVFGADCSSSSQFEFSGKDVAET